MKKIELFVALAAVMVLGLAAGIKAEVKAGIAVSSTGVNSFYLAIGDYNRVPEKEVVVVKQLGIPDEELPVVFFIANRAKVSKEEIIKLRLKRWSWMKIVRNYRMDPAHFYVPVKTKVIKGYYGNAYRYYQTKPQDKWNSINLSDKDIVNCVNLRFVSEYYKHDPDDVIRMRDSGKNFIAIDNDMRLRHIVKKTAKTINKIQAANDGAYDRDGFDRDGFNREGFNRDGYDRTWHHRDGYDRKGYDKHGYDRDGFDRDGYDRDGFSKDGYDKKWHHRDGYDRKGFDKHGYDRDGYDRKGFDRDGYDKKGYDRKGYDKDGYDKKGYDIKGYDEEGYDLKGYDRKKQRKQDDNHEGYNKKRYDKQGHDKKRYDNNGRDNEGYDREGYDEKGYDNRGYDKKGRDGKGNEQQEFSEDDTKLYKNKHKYNDDEEDAEDEEDDNGHGWQKNNDNGNWKDNGKHDNRK